MFLLKLFCFFFVAYCTLGDDQLHCSTSLGSRSAFRRFSRIYKKLLAGDRKPTAEEMEYLKNFVIQYADQSKTAANSSSTWERYNGPIICGKRITGIVMVNKKKQKSANIRKLFLYYYYYDGQYVQQLQKKVNMMTVTAPRNYTSMKFSFTSKCRMSSHINTTTSNVDVTANNTDSEEWFKPVVGRSSVTKGPGYLSSHITESDIIFTAATFEEAIKQIRLLSHQAQDVTEETEVAPEMKDFLLQLSRYQKDLTGRTPNSDQSTRTKK